MKSFVATVVALMMLGSFARADDEAAPAPAVVDPPSEPPPPAPIVAPPAPAPAPLETLPPLPAPPAISDRAASRNFAGSVQLDYLQLVRRTTTPDKAFAGPTVELSLKLAMDLGDHVTANVKVCYACHGFEVGMAYFDLRANDELNVRVGRFSPAFGSFPLRHDPANHSTSDKPLAYDMGRMVRFRDWNEGILPAPYVDNGVEINGSHSFGPTQLDYAAYAMAGPKGNPNNFDFDFTRSRSGEAYYVDNNSEPMVGARVSLNIDLARRRNLTIGGSAMAGHYDDAAALRFSIVGGDATLQLGRTFVRAEYLARWTHFAPRPDPEAQLKFGPGANGIYSTFIFKDAFDVEAEHPIGRVSLIGRVDGLRRRGNVLADSMLSNYSTVVRVTAGVAIRLVSTLQLKTSVERYIFNDFADETAIHLGIAGPF